jgi:uncharacterized repeat protein (TIGR03803 family)
MSRTKVFAIGASRAKQILLFLVLSAAAAIGQSQIALVQVTGSGNVFTAAQKAGDLNVFLASWNDDTTTITSVTDTAGNTYTQFLHTTTSAGGGLSQDIWSTANIKAYPAGKNALAITTSTGQYMSYLRIHGFEYSGMAAVASGAGMASTGDSAHPNPGGIVVTNSPNSMLFCATKSQLGDYVAVQPPGFTEIYSDENYVGDEADDALNVPPPPPGWYGCSPTLNASGAWITQLASFAGADSVTTLFSFNGTDGAGPQGPLAQGLDGNFYGTTAFGGAEHGGGNFFKITPAGDETVLYDFCSQPSCTDGVEPFGNLVLAANGNFSGMTRTGGLPDCVAGQGCGTLFEITPTGKLTTVHSFCSQTNCADGGFPTWLVQGTDGSFYGTTSFGGDGAECIGGPKDEKFCGTVFKLTPTGKLTTLHSFCSETNCTDGAQPSSLLQAANGNFYGTTLAGGTNAVSPCNGGLQPGCGTIFEITPGGKLTTLYNFCSQANCADGLSPNSLMQGSDGKFYGTTTEGGNCDSESCGGTAFVITPAGKLTTLHGFCAETNCFDGASPVGLLQATDGNFYGTTTGGGGAGGGGTVFEITRAGNVIAPLYSFCSYESCESGYYPNLLVQATNGSFYGTTAGGGAITCGGKYPCGTVFSLSLGLGRFVETLPTSGSVGTKVTILGNHLSGTTAVSFHGTTAPFKIVSSTEITTTVPEGATTGTVKVTTSSGTLDSNVVFRVTTTGD